MSNGDTDIIADLANGLKSATDKKPFVTPNLDSVTDLAKAIRPKKAGDQKDVNIAVVETSSVNNDFTKREPEKVVKTRTKYPEPYSTRMRAGMADLIADTIHAKKITKQEMFEKAIGDYLEKEGRMELIVRYNELVKDD